MKINTHIIGSAMLFLAGCNLAQKDTIQMEDKNKTENHSKHICTPLSEIVKSEEEWKKELTPDQYKITRLKGTERAFTGKYYDHHEKGAYHCVCCGAPLFESKTKFDSGTGWPSFFAPVDSNSIKESKDTSYGMIRTEVMCQKCGAHLGHVFDDGPKPTGLRYCINSESLKFKKKE